jgi:hypothetical protein
MASVKGLLERVRAATGPDREIDGMIEAVIVHGRELVQDVYLPTGARCWLARNKQMPHDAYVVWVAGADGPTLKIAAFTGSVDAALALTERMLPGALIEIRTGGKFHHCYIDGETSPDFEEEFQAENMPTAPLAIIAALLTALSLDTNKGDGV